jgi:NAD(P)-dependent dehydrogenase (short-subunit alcohol dehydrogenase family)
MEKIMHISGKTVLITGANRGVGAALVKEALNRGAKRVFAGTRGALSKTDPRVKALTLDVTNTSHIQRAVEEVSNLDVLINNAAISIYGDLTNLDVIHLTDPDVIQKQLDVNLLGLESLLWLSRGAFDATRPPHLLRNRARIRCKCSVVE